LRATPLGPLKTKKEVSEAPTPHLTDSNEPLEKQCADKNLGTKFRQRGNSLYLAFLIGRAKSTHSYAFLFELQPLPTPCTNNAHFTAAAYATCIHQAGSMRSFAFSTSAVACSSSGS
jgi:hypothetical protein